MKFLPSVTYTSPSDIYSGYGKIEHYISTTKMELDSELTKLITPKIPNITPIESKNLKNLKNMKSTVTIIPADKNLGIVILNTDDYVNQCIVTLSDGISWECHRSEGFGNLFRLGVEMGIVVCHVYVECRKIWTELL